MNWGLVVTAGVSVLVALLVNVVQPHVLALLKRREAVTGSDHVGAVKHADVVEENIERLSKDNVRLRERNDVLEAGREDCAQDRIALYRTQLTIGELKDHLDDMESDIAALVGKLGECPEYPEIWTLATDVLHAVRRGKAIGGAA